MREKLNNKTCGECRYYEHPAGQCSKVIEYNNCHITDKACEYFEPKVITKGDKIIKQGNNGLAAFACGLLNDKSEETFQRVLSFLNAPAESEVEDDNS